MISPQKYQKIWCLPFKRYNTVELESWKLHSFTIHTSFYTNYKLKMLVADSMVECQQCMHILDSIYPPQKMHVCICYYFMTEHFDRRENHQMFLCRLNPRQLKSDKLWLHTFKRIRQKYFVLHLKFMLSQTNPIHLPRKYCKY